MKNKIEKSTKILIASLILTIGLFSMGSVVATADDDDDDEHKYSREYRKDREEIIGEQTVEIDTSHLSDSDNDGVIDSLDQHPGEDDLIYAVSDINEDGIDDDFAYLVNSIYGNIR